MARRNVALCNGEYIGIETIYTIINGKQINIQGKVDSLREKGRNGELFCPCGCGTNLILVAGDKNLREQHFREKKGTGNCKCTVLIEGQTSIDSKIVLKCWLDDKLGANDIKSRVPINTIETTKRRPEFTFLSLEKNFGIRYWYDRLNIVDEKLDVLSCNISGIKVIYVVDCSNGGNNGQYPESLIKIQNKQGYCLLLNVDNNEYDKATLKVIFYEQDIDGLWEEIVVVEECLRDYDIIKNTIMIQNKTLEELLEIARENFNNRQENEKKRRNEVLRRREEEKRIQEEKKKREIEERKKQRKEKEKLRLKNRKNLRKNFQVMV